MGRTRDTCLFPSRALGARVMSLVDLLQTLLHDVGIDLRRGDIAVTEHQLDGAKIRAAFQKMCCKTMTQHVGRKRHTQTSSPAIGRKNFPNTYSAESAATAIQKECLRIRKCTLAEKLGARRTFGPNEKLPRRVDVVVDNIGKATWEHSLQSVRAGGTVVAVGVTSGDDASANLLRLVSDKITVMGSIMGTLEEMNNMIRLVINAGIKPEIGAVMPMEEAKEAFLAMVGGRTSGKTVFTR